MHSLLIPEKYYFLTNARNYGPRICPPYFLQIQSYLEVMEIGYGYSRVKLSAFGEELSSCVLSPQYLPQASTLCFVSRGSPPL